MAPRKPKTYIGNVRAAQRRMGSKRGRLDPVADGKRLARGAAVAAAGVVLTYLTTEISNFDFARWTPIVVAAWSVVANAVRLLLSDTREKCE